ncbi:hypothetical protein RF11_00318 [Thelohanellus kitauei]|uniref:PDZ domain-containing protein n=1 Tax=Thelohanellus kitauei TaxID=669202 RepID=A0A0C2IRU1_THEKT|nr:hypothetical protein RF11_00318 [Thelohanellus kitauei]
MSDDVKIVVTDLDENSKRQLPMFSLESVTIKNEYIIRDAVKIETFPPESRKTFGLEKFNLFITHIESSQELSVLNIRPGDRVLKINGKDIHQTNLNEYRKIINEQEYVTLDVRHDPEFDNIKVRSAIS